MENFFSYGDFLKSVKSGKVSLVEYYKNLFEKIKNEDKEINSFISLNENYLTKVEESQKRISEGEARLLEGLPISIKDNITIKDMKCTCGSKILENFISPYNATVIDRLEKEGAIFVGKVNMDEFAMGSTTETSYFGPTKNPINKQYTPGGSSGGSAASVAANFCLASLGSDTGGSVRQPASFCGIVGYKPSYGVVSRYGLVAFGSSLDQIGTLTNNCEDAALITSVIMGKDEKDSTSSNVEIENIKNFKTIDVKGKKFGVIKETMSENTDKNVKATIEKRINDIEKLGGIVEYTSIKDLELGISIYYIIAPAEASSNLARYDGVRYGLQVGRDKDIDVKSWFTKTRSEGFGDEVKRRIIIGNFVLSSGYYDAYYKKAQKARIVIADRFKEAFTKFDYLLTPTSPVLPFKIGEGINDPLKLYTADLCTIPVNLAGLPAVSIPAGEVDGLPVGLQIIASRFRDGLMLGVADYLHKNFG